MSVKSIEANSETKIPAIRVTERIALQAAQDYPQMAQDYLGDLNCRHEDLAALYLPQEMERNREIAINAVGKALQMLIKKRDYEKLRRNHRQAYHEKLSQEGYYQGEEHQQRSVNGGRMRVSEWDQQEHRHVFDDLNTALGRQLWADKEKELAWSLSSDPKFSHNGRLRRFADYERIAQKLNSRFHQGQEVRGALDVSSAVRVLRSKAKKAR